MGGETCQNYKDRLMKKNKTLESNSRIRKLLVKDLPQVIEIQEAIIKSKVSPKRKAILKGTYSDCSRPTRKGKY